MSSFLKHRDQLVDGPRGRVHWNRASRDGVPFRGNSVPMLKDEEFEELAEHTHDCAVHQLNTSKPEDLATLQDIYDKAVAGLAKILVHEKNFSESAGGYIILIAYSITFLEMPPEKAARVATQASVLSRR